MFPSSHPSVESAAAARRRHRPISRPSSRTQHRRERSGSNASISRNVREGSVVSQRGVSGSFTDRELVPLGKAMIMASARGDGKNVDGGAVDWTKNHKFRVSKLPALPPSLKAANPTPITAATEGSNGYALILSHNAAYVWQYTTPDTIPHTFSFPLPSDEQGSYSPFPLGALVAPSANSDEPGLVVVMPLSGRTAYWDSVGSAVAEGLFSKRRGVEGKVPLVSGESVTAVCNAEPAGFILSLSSGRLAHLALRDPAGRPGITVTIMRGYGTGMMGGFLGALRAGSSRRDIVAVRAGRILRMGEREIIVATARGNFSRWQVNRSGTYANVADADARDNILAAIERVSPEEVELRSKDAFVIVDAAVGENYDTTDGENHDLDVLVLASFMPTPNSSGALHVLISLKFRAGGIVDACDVHVVKCYTTPLEEGKTRPRLYLPRPGRTAFLVFSRAVVLVSTQKPEADENDMDEDTDDQGAFEDVVDFRGDSNVEIVGSGPEEVTFDSSPRLDLIGSFTSDAGTSGAGKKTRNPGVMLVAKGAGVVRLETFDLEPTKKKALTEPAKVKNKIEQAVFYGVKEDNPLNFQGRKEIEYETAEIESAALEISQEILSSTSEYLPAVLPSLDTHLSLRAAHLRALAEHLRTTFPPLSRNTMWRLLSDAEKCHAARAVWNVRESHLRHRQGEEGTLETVIPELLASDDDIGGSDPIRTWFLRFIGSIEDLIPEAKKAMVEKTKKGRYDRVTMARMDTEANDIVLAALTKAWDFRVRSVKLYRLNRPGTDPNGIMAKTTGLAPPWTSGTEILQALGVHQEISVAMVKTLWGPRLVSNLEGKEVIERVAEQLVGLAEVCCRGFEERSLWCEQQGEVGGEGILQEGITIKERYMAQRGSWIKPLAELGMSEKAYELAEKWQDYRTLVELCSEEIMRIEASQKELSASTSAPTSEREAAELNQAKKHMIRRMEAYFDKFGEVYALEMYEYLVERGQLQKLLNGFEAWRETYLTRFLRSNKKYAKLSWIHDVGLGEYALAASTLLHVATEQEDDQWNKKVELSIAKLAKLAAAAPATPDEPGIRGLDAELELVDIQNRVFQAVGGVRRATIDTEAAVQVSLERYAGGHLTGKKRAGCRELWKRAFARAVEGKVMGVEEIADLLTLADACGIEDWAPLMADVQRGEEFYWALRALSLGGLASERRSFMEKSIWRRCFLRDDWQAIVDTRNKSDRLVTDATRRTAVYRTIKLGYEKGLFAHDSPYTPLAPEETFFSDTLDELRSRFARADESELATIGHDLAQENRMLARFLDRADLRVWFAGVLDAARREAYGDAVEEEMMMEE